MFGPPSTTEAAASDDSGRGMAVRVLLTTASVLLLLGFAVCACSCCPNSACPVPKALSSPREEHRSHTYHLVHSARWEEQLPTPELENNSPHFARARLLDEQYLRKATAVKALRSQRTPEIVPPLSLPSSPPLSSRTPEIMSSSSPPLPAVSDSSLAMPSAWSQPSSLHSAWSQSGPRVASIDRSSSRDARSPTRSRQFAPDM